MAIPDWNTLGLPPWSYVKDTPNDNYIRFTTGAGTGKTRRRSTNMGRQLSFTLLITGAERTILDNLHDDSIKFTHSDPKDDSVQTFKFAMPPQYQLRTGDEDPDKRVWQVTLSLIRK